MTSPGQLARETEYEGPRVRLRGNVRDNSRAFGLPVVSADRYNHAPECYWCDGQADNDTCPRSVVLSEYARRLDEGSA